MMSSIAIYFLYFVFSNPNNHLCFPEERGSECTPQAPEPVCAVFSGDSCSSSTGFCQKTLTSPCLACSDPSIIAYIPGACDVSMAAQTCSDTENSSLNKEEEVCGYTQSKRLGGQKISAETFSNGENACKQNTVDFYTKGKCQESSLNICQKGQAINEGCFGSSMPSCVYYAGEDCSEKLCRKTVENSCLSCADSSVLFYHEGSCEDRDPQIIRELEYIPDQQEFQVKRSSTGDSDFQEEIPELEAVIQQDGSVVFEKVDNNSTDENSVFLRHVDNKENETHGNEGKIDIEILNKRD